MTKKRYSRKALFESLDNAVENGYDLRVEGSHDIAVDLGSYDERFEGAEPDDLVPLIDAWKKARGGDVSARNQGDLDLRGGGKELDLIKLVITVGQQVGRWRVSARGAPVARLPRRDGRPFGLPGSAPWPLRRADDPCARRP
jgi:hypothetical protein